MAIIKNSNNMTIRVKSGYQLFVGQNVQKIAGKINVEARKKKFGTGQ
jgi:hypothetical protein